MGRFRWTAATSEASWRSYGPAAALGGLVGFVCATPTIFAPPGIWAATLAVFVALIVLGGVVGILAALIAGRVVGSAGWVSYAVIFAVPLIAATIRWWSSPIGVPVVAIALLGGAFIGRYIVHRPIPAADPPALVQAQGAAVARKSRREFDPDRSIVGLRLEDAMVDADGTAYGTGALTFQPDPHEVFRPAAGSMLSLSSTRDDELVFGGCDIRRDDVTGYLVGHPVGPRLVVPKNASEVIRTVLRMAGRAPQSFSARSGGALIEGDNVQHLTEMFGSVQSFGENDDDGGVVVVELTASLRAERDGRNFWRPSPTAERVSLSFTITPITRVVRFGAHSSALPAWLLEPRQTEPTELNRMRLSTSLIGALDSSYGRADDGSMVGLYNRGERGLTLELGLQERRNGSGLISPNNGYPRVRLTPVDLDDVAERLGADRRFSIALGEGAPENIQYTSGGPDGPGRSGQTTASRLDFEITSFGLVIDWVAHREGDLPPLRGRVTVPWEVLVMRFPRFARYRGSSA